MNPILRSAARRRCHWAAATAVAVAVAGSPFVVAGAANAAAGTSDIDITVYDGGTYHALSGQTVTLYSTATGAVVGSPIVTGFGGDADFTGLEQGSYTAKVSASSKYREKYSTVVTVGDGDSGYNEVVLAPVSPSYGRLSGTVTKPADMLQADVEVFPATATDESIASGDVQPVYETGSYGYDYDDETATTDWNVSLAPGAYKVLVADDDSPKTVDHELDGWSEHASQVWIGSGSSNDADHATAFTVAAAKTTKTGSVALAGGSDDAGGRITGTVTGTAGAKLADVRVDLFQQQEDGSWNEVNATTTGKDGTFSFSETYEYDYGYGYGYGETTPIQAGVYTVGFEDRRNEYGSEFLGDTPGTLDDNPPEGVPTITLGDSDHQVADASLSVVPIDRSSGAYGSVTDDLGHGHPGYVQVYDVYGNYAVDLLTRRDGTWAAPATELAPGQYRATAQDDVDVDGWYGGQSFKTARTVTVPVKGAADLGRSLLARFAAITGRITLPTVAGRDSADAYVTIYDADGDPIDGRRLDDTGAYTFTEAPGTYYVAASGTLYDSFDNTDVVASQLRLIRQFWKGKYSIGTATPIKVGSGGRASGVNIALGRTLAATAAPSIAGTPKVNSVLKASTGTWNVSHDVAFTYTWKRNGAVVSHAASYKVTAADQGALLTVTVGAADTNQEFASGSSTSKPVAVPKAKHKKKKHKKKHK